MLTFRYHIVTLVAVFMAIGLGVLFGATFIDQNIVEGLKATQVRLGARNEDLRQRIVDQEKLNDQLAAFATSARDGVVRGTLTNQPVLFLNLESAPGDVVDAVQETLNAAGAKVYGRVILAKELDLQSDDVRNRLAAILGSSSTQPATLSSILNAQITGELTGRNPPVLQRLIDEGLAGGELGPVPAPVEGQPPLAPVVVLVAGEASKELNERLVWPLAKTLADGPVVAALAEPGVDEAILRPLRDDSIKVVTVDAAESAVSQALLATGLKAAIAGSFGSYGAGEGATTSVPAS